MPRLPETTERAWAHYVRLEEDGIRSESMPALAEFIQLISPLEEVQWHEWAKAVARKCVDEDDSLPIRFPLFRQVLFPALLAGVRDQEPGCARWLAGFHHLLCKSPECGDQLQDGEATEIALLRKALQHDPGDGLARERLIGAMQWRLEYSLHELPSGVLLDAKGATIEECTELQRDLEEFEALVVQHDVQEAHAALIEDCRIHYYAYPEYLRQRSRYSSYDQDLRQAGPA